MGRNTRVAVRKGIKNILKEHDKLGFGELKREVIKREITNERTFQIVLNEMREVKEVERVKDGQKSWYSVYPQVFEDERAMLQYFNELFADLDYLFNKFRKRYDELSTTERTQAVTYFIHRLNFIEFRLTRFVQRFNNKEIRALGQRPQDFADKLFHFVQEKDIGFWIVSWADSRLEAHSEQARQKLYLMLKDKRFKK